MRWRQSTQSNATAPPVSRFSVWGVSWKEQRPGALRVTFRILSWKRFSVQRMRSSSLSQVSNRTTVQCVLYAVKTRLLMGKAVQSIFWLWRIICLENSRPSDQRNFIPWNLIEVRLKSVLSVITYVYLKERIVLITVSKFSASTIFKNTFCMSARKPVSGANFVE